MENRSIIIKKKSKISSINYSINETDFNDTNSSFEFQQKWRIKLAKESKLSEKQELILDLLQVLKEKNDSLRILREESQKLDIETKELKSNRNINICSFENKIKEIKVKICDSRTFHQSVNSLMSMSTGRSCVHCNEMAVELDESISKADKVEDLLIDYKMKLAAKSARVLDLQDENEAIKVKIEVKL